MEIEVATPKKKSPKKEGKCENRKVRRNNIKINKENSKPGHIISEV